MDDRGRATEEATSGRPQVAPTGGRPSFVVRPSSFVRLPIAVVLAWNVQCALAFILAPATYAPGFELAGPPGEAAVQGMGVLFLMWNVPYAVALLHPLRHRISLYEALTMQTIGLLGESFIYLTLPAAHTTARQSLARFIVFDAAGVVLLALAVVIVFRAARSPVPPTSQVGGT